jgi:hypothetical protein
VKDLGHWVTQLPVQEPISYGFIYEITNNIDNKKYIGKKQCVTVKKLPPLKGKKNKRHEIKETDWKTYTSSCRELNEDLQRLGKDNFTFNIIKWCNSKSELAYWEAKTQFDKDVLLREDYYNGIINLRVSRIKTK